MTMTLTLTCAEFGCHRTFVTDEALSDHAAVVHFNEIRTLVGDQIKDEFGDSYIEDMTAEYVVFECYMEGEGYSLYQATYEIADDNTVTLGDCSEVIRSVSYSPKPDGSVLSKKDGGGMGGMGSMPGMDMKD
jgi:hypothetical protein